MTQFNNVVRLVGKVEEGLASGTMSQGVAVNTITALRKAVAPFVGSGVLTEDGEVTASNILTDISVIMMMIEEDRCDER